MRTPRTHLAPMKAQICTSMASMLPYCGCHSTSISMHSAGLGLGLGLGLGFGLGLGLGLGLGFRTAVEHVVGEELRR